MPPTEHRSLRGVSWAGLGVLAEKIRHPDGKVHLWNEHLARDVERLRASVAVADDVRLRLIGRRDQRSHNS